MKNSKLFLIIQSAFLLLCLNFLCFGEDTIVLHFTHNRKIQCHDIVVKILNKDSSSTAINTRTDCAPYYTGYEWKNYEFEGTIKIDEYRSLLNMIAGFDDSLLTNDKMTVQGTDGTTWSLVVKLQNVKREFTIWSPDFDTKKRKLNSFYSLCKSILKLGHINPENEKPFR
jgi:hypothetical protein